ncbi:hypothetical protein BDR26DRAFT_854363, partial [Obelidium mucronatum]
IFNGLLITAIPIIIWQSAKHVHRREYNDSTALIFMLLIITVVLSVLIIISKEINEYSRFKELLCVWVMYTVVLSVLVVGRVITAMVEALEEVKVDNGAATIIKSSVARSSSVREEERVPKRESETRVESVTCQQICKSAYHLKPLIQKDQFCVLQQRRYYTFCYWCVWCHSSTWKPCSIDLHTLNHAHRCRSWISIDSRMNSVCIPLSKELVSFSRFANTVHVNPPPKEGGGWGGFRRNLLLVLEFEDNVLAEQVESQVTQN